jgi:hypothetical protein
MLTRAYNVRGVFLKNFACYYDNGVVWRNWRSHYIC